MVMVTPKQFEVLVADRPLRIETGKLAYQANGAVLVQYGETVVLVTACMSPTPREGVDFFPLTVDFEERLYAAGKIPGSYWRREGRPTPEAILWARLTDRPIRPLFPKGLRNDVQVVTTTLSVDMENPPDILSIIGASAALCISDIPFDKPIGAVRVGYINGQFVVNPTTSEQAYSSLDLVVAGTRDAVVMVEAGAREVPEEVIIEGIRFGHQALQPLIDLQEEMVRAVGKPKLTPELLLVPEGVLTAVAEFLGDRLLEAAYVPDKTAREKALDELKRQLEEHFTGIYDPAHLRLAFDARLKELVRRRILEENLRPDGRGPKDIRPISAEVSVLPRTHGSGLFTRGQTQVLSTVTLGSLSEMRELDWIGPEEFKRFMHHYNFPPYSTGEVRRIGPPSRREIGHGALVERALQSVIPGEEEFPYTIRVVSEVLSSNGSTSMASVCGSTLALMDAGVPIKAPVAGIAMGLVMGEDGRYSILTDIQGIEDALGDMDFKVAGTAQGVTALQMDIKVAGLTYEILKEALDQAREARLYILSRMHETISEVRPELSKYAPRMYKIQINPDKIRNVIGPGGKTIRSIIEKTKTTIDIHDDGTVIIGATNAENAQKAIQMIEALTRDVEVGAIYTGRVTRILPFGAFVEILPGKEGLIHISELAPERVNRVEDVVKVGDEVTVMVTEIDRLGRINLSRRAVLTGEPPRPRPASPAPRPGAGGRERSAPRRPGGERRSPAPAGERSGQRPQNRRPAGSRPEGRPGQRPPRETG